MDYRIISAVSTVLQICACSLKAIILYEEESQIHASISHKTLDKGIFQSQAKV